MFETAQVLLHRHALIEADSGAMCAIRWVGKRVEDGPCTEVFLGSTEPRAPDPDEVLRGNE